MFNIVSKANQMLGFLRRNCIHLPDVKCRRTLYLAFVKAHLCYGSELWAPQSTSMRPNICCKIINPPTLTL